ncbi:hypothetical protein SAMN05421743_10825 [Thalassobacillus cyri]|uniref:Sulfotransferase domain-containing protein n=1 Tax=Thalassobacillus cyri TaxID=571932 RepID=A0A1H4DWE5_9BACI|nr:hypothetical protein [Thalassobacillus cyri]SEA76819.1 hypothetical protein SAMN05421743_10825 [Thalassobacillus cyri]
MDKIVHIGYHKTGTTFLQDVLFPKHPEIHYVDRMTTQKYFLRVGSLFFDADKVKNEIKTLENSVDNGKKALVFSDEELSGHIHTGGNGGYLSKEVADRIHQVMPDAKIMINVRNQVKMIDSVYRQYIKKGGTFSVEKYLFNNNGLPHRQPRFQFAHFEYDRLVEYYINLFGRENVFVYLYEDFKQDKSFYNDMLEEMGLSSIDNIKKMSSDIKNPSYSEFSLAVAKYFNRFYGEDPINRRCIVHIPYLYKIVKKLLFNYELKVRKKSPGSVLDEDTKHYIEDYYRESNRRLMELIAQDVTRYHYPVSHTSTNVGELVHQ